MDEDIKTVHAVIHILPAYFFLKSVVRYDTTEKIVLITTLNVGRESKVVEVITEIKPEIMK